MEHTSVVKILIDYHVFLLDDSIFFFLMNCLKGQWLAADGSKSFTSSQRPVFFSIPWQILLTTHIFFPIVASHIGIVTMHLYYFWEDKI